MKKQLLKDVKVVMHKEYDHELAKFYNRKRYMKEQKKFKKKRERQKLKKIDY